MSWLSAFSFSREPDPQCVALQASLKSVLSRIEAAERSLVLIAETDEVMPESRRSLVRSTYGDKEERLRRAQEVVEVVAGAGKSRADHTSSMRLHLSELVECLSAAEQTLRPLVGRHQGGTPASDAPEALLERLALKAAAAVRSIYRDNEEARSTKTEEEVEELITKYAGSEEELLAKVKAKYPARSPATAVRSKSPSPTVLVEAIEESAVVVALVEEAGKTGAEEAAEAAEAAEEAEVKAAVKAAVKAMAVRVTGVAVAAATKVAEAAEAVEAAEAAARQEAVEVRAAVKGALKGMTARIAEAAEAA